jgi:hypothetical protein
MPGATFNLIVDKNAPKDQNVIITFSSVCRLKKWNNIDIEEELYGKKGSKGNDKAILAVPAGNNSFSFNTSYLIDHGRTSSVYRFKDIELRYNLEQGKEYKVIGTAMSKGFLKGYEFFIQIHDITGNDTLLKSWKIGEVSGEVSI